MSHARTVTLISGHKLVGLLRGEPFSAWEVL